MTTLHKLKGKYTISHIGFNSRYFAYMWHDERKEFDTLKELFEFIRLRGI